MLPDLTIPAAPKLPTLRPRGNPQHKFWVIGSAPTWGECHSGQAWTGTSGGELDRALGAAGLTPSSVAGTYLLHTPSRADEEHVVRKKQCPDPRWRQFAGVWVSPSFLEARDRLIAELQARRPEFILLCGNLVTFALTGEWGVRKWRSSTMRCEALPETVVICTWDPSIIERDWSIRPTFGHDVGRVARQVISGKIRPRPYRHTIRPTIAQCRAILRAVAASVASGPTPLGVDFETRAGHIACLGIAWSDSEALCIPFMCSERPEGYWAEAEEQEIVLALRDILTHPNALCIFQNGLYDCQYFQRWWGFVPNFVLDTMVCHHSCFSADQKSLGYLSSLYCEHHVYWKDDGKTWEAKMDEDQLWTYNCFDCCRTFEIAYALWPTVLKLNRLEVVRAQHDLIWQILAATVKGVRINLTLKSSLTGQLHQAFADREQWLLDVLGHPINIRSPKQMQALFYTDFGIKPIRSRKGKRGITTDDEALTKIGKSDPLLKRITDVVSEMRSLGVFASTFLEARVDWDQRMRSSFNPCGTETYRLSSSQNAFDGGLNFQNVPEGDEENSSGYPYPNIRKLFIPDPGYVWFDMDLDRADLQVVVWEAEDEELKYALRAGVDLHILNGLTIFNHKIPPLDELVETHPNYLEHKKRYGKQRQFAKTFIHGTNYGGGARTMAITAGITVRESEAFQLRWFSAHPGIRKWHERTQRQLFSRRYVENRFGYRRYYFDRPDGLLPEALAWVPQSTVAIVINRAWRAILRQMPQVDVLIQVHDSLAGQFPLAGWQSTRDELLRVSRIEIPYDDPLTIPTGLALSRESWGDVVAASEFRG